MAITQRFFLTNTAAGFTPTNFRGAWDQTTNQVTKSLGRLPSGVATTVASAEAVTTNLWDVLLYRGVSDPFDNAYTFTTSDLVAWVAGVLESANNANDFFHVHIYVTVGNTDTVRGTLLTDNIGATEWTTAATGRGEGTKALAGLVCSAGDRLVVEIGYQAQNTSSTSFTGTMNYGGTSNSITQGSTAVTTKMGWVEFTTSAHFFSTSPVTWDAGHTTVNAVLSDGNLLTTVTNAGSNLTGSTLATLSRGTGKYVVSFKIKSIDTFGPQFGLATSGLPTTVSPGDYAVAAIPNAEGAAMQAGSGLTAGVYVTTTQISSGFFSIGVGDTVFIAFDLDNRKWYGRVNNDGWCGTGGTGAVPDSGTNPYDLSGDIASGKTWFLAIGYDTGSATGAKNGVELDASAFGHGLSTFLPWDTAGSAPAAVDWPNPTLRRAMPIGLDSQPEGSAENLTTLQGQDRVYGNPGQVPDYDWPNPTLSRALPAGITSQPLGSERNVNLLVGQDALPVRQIDWPNPVLRIPPQRAIEAQTNGIGLADATAFPLTMQNDIPNPTLRVYRMQAIIQSQTAPLNLTTLVGQDRFYGAAGEVVCYDWPNPQGPPRRTIAMDAQPLGALITLSAATAAPTSQDDWPNPRGSQPVHQLQPLGSPLILSTLVGKDALPFRQSDWPNPVLRVSSVAAINAQPEGSPLNVTTLVGQDKLAFRELDWPNPVLRVSFVAAINSQILGQTTPVEEAEVVSAQYDWPVPPGWQPRTQTQPLGSPLNITLLVGKDALPFRELDWPNPILRPSHVAAINAQILGQTTPIEESEVVASQDDWPNPPGPLPRTQTQPLGSPLNLTLLVGQDALPSRQRDWPNPVLRPSSVAAIAAQPSGSPLNLTTLPGQDALPFRQREWPVPAAARQPERPSPLGSPSILTVLVGQDALPLRQRDWPNPRGAQQPTQTQPYGTPPAFLSPAVPFAQTSWPVPPGARQPTQTQPFGSPGVLTLLVGQDRLPARQLTWENPRSPAQPVQTQPLGMLATLQAALVPFAQLVWPNPPGARSLPIVQPDGAPGLLGVLVGKDRLPSRLLDWPNPGRPAAWIVALHGQPQGGKASDAPLRPVDIPNPPGLGRAVALAAQPLGGQVRVAAVPVLAVDLPVPVPRAVPATLSQPLGSPLLLTVLPGQDALPFRQSEWPNPPGAQPHMQTGPEGVPSLLRPDTLPPIIAHPELLGSEVPADLEGSETAINLGASQTPLALAGSDAQVALKGSVVVINLKGGVDT